MVEEEIRCSNLLSWVKLSRSNLIERKQRIEMTTKFKGKERKEVKLPSSKLAVTCVRSFMFMWLGPR